MKEGGGGGGGEEEEGGSTQQAQATATTAAGEEEEERILGEFMTETAEIIEDLNGVIADAQGVCVCVQACVHRVCISRI